MKQLLTAILFLSSINSFADTPGKPQMDQCKVSFQNIANFNNYNFYWCIASSADKNIVASDTSFSLMSTRGAPPTYFFWAINKTTQKSTDTLKFYNYYSPDYVVILNDIKKDSLLFSKKELSNQNTIIKNEDWDSIANKQLVTDAKKAKQNHYIKIGGFVALGVAALGAIVWFFRKRNKKQNAV